MRVSVVIEQRFDRTPDGAVWTTGQFPRSYWDRHLLVFDAVNVISRVRDVGELPHGAVRADGDGVTMTAIPHYLGPRQYLRQVLAIRRSVRASVAREDAVLLRVGSQLAAVLEPELRRTGHPYGVEVVTDPHEMFSARASSHRLRAFFRWKFTRALRRQCAGAVSAAYVTEAALQRRYPPAPGAFATHYSDGDLDPEAFVNAVVSRPRSPGAIHLISVGSLAQMYKSPDVVIRAVAACVDDGLDLHLTWIGDGRFRSEMEHLATSLGIRERVAFAGNLPAGEAVRSMLDTADIFVLASRTEGLPRALVEAMARGLPCIASAIGGIPELLHPDDLVPPGDQDALAATIRAMAGDPARMSASAERNLLRARAFATSLIRQRQVAMMQQLQAETERWLTSASARQVTRTESR